MRQMFSAIADYEKTMNVPTLRAARQRIWVREGKREGSKAFGILSRSATIRGMTELAGEGLNYTHIAGMLVG